MNSSLKLIILILIPLFSFGQEKDFYDLDNSFYELYSKAKVKSLKVTTKEFDNGIFKEKYIELIQSFAKNGDLIREREFYDSDSTDGWEVNYKYNDNHQTVRTEWTWLDDKDQELTEYEYDSDNKLIKSCDYYKSTNATEFQLEECLIYVYRKNRIFKVKTTDNELKNYYKKKGDSIFGYSADKKLKYKYKNGEFVYQNMDLIIFKYDRNEIGQILKTTKTDNNENLIFSTIYEYSNGLLRKVVSKDKYGTLRRDEDYQYEYYE
ncbi:MAG: hypothetical protein V3V28_05755 [Polaribacter sp.]|uniref:hypothetical protein n=1 Tax=Polaribacter sp. TaxID=1920175 RepID=UPI002F35F2DC